MDRRADWVGRNEENAQAGRTPWFGAGALVAAVIGAGFLLSGDRIPELLAATASNAPGDPTPDTA